MKTIIFSNTTGNIFANGKVSFIPNMEKLLNKMNLNGLDLIYVDAPMKGYDCDIVYNNIIECFKKINIDFKKVYRISYESKPCNLPKNNVIWFLTGGSPITQMDIIKIHKLENKIKNAEIVIGFCAGGINISKHAIITSDADFKETISYRGLARINLTIEPHFNYETTAFFENRIREITDFAKKLKTSVTAIPDTSLIYQEDNKLVYIGEITTFC